MVAIVGCGWLGSALKSELEQEFRVECIGRDYKAKQSILKGAKFVIISIPPKQNYLESLKELLSIIDSAQIILISSISYYRGKELVVKGEKFIRTQRAKATIIRFGGLMGEDRIAGKYTQGKSLKDGLSHYIHKMDAVGIIKEVILQNINSTTIDAIAPKQALKSVIFVKNGKKFNFKKTNFNGFDKALNLNKELEKLNYKFKKESVLEFWD